MRSWAIARRGAEVAARKPSSRWETGPRTAGRLPGSGWRPPVRLHPVVSGGDGHPGPRADRIASHLNPGVSDLGGVGSFRPVGPEYGHDAGDHVGTAVFNTRGGSLHGSPDRDPAVRRRVLSDAGRAGSCSPPACIGIGESLPERADSILPAFLVRGTPWCRKSSFRTSARSPTPRCATGTIWTALGVPGRAGHHSGGARSQDPDPGLLNPSAPEELGAPVAAGG